MLSPLGDICSSTGPNAPAANKTAPQTAATRLKRPFMHLGISPPTHGTLDSSKRYPIQQRYHVNKSTSLIGRRNSSSLIGFFVCFVDIVNLRVYAYFVFTSETPA
jgi:hypothetical protein